MHQRPNILCVKAVSTVARTCVFPRVARFCVGQFSCGLRGNVVGAAGEMSFFPVHAYCGNKILGATIFVRSAEELTGFV